MVINRREGERGRGGRRRRREVEGREDTHLTYPTASISNVPTCSYSHSLLAIALYRLHSPLAAGSARAPAFLPRWFLVRYRFYTYQLTCPPFWPHLVPCGRLRITMPPALLALLCLARMPPLPPLPAWLPPLAACCGSPSFLPDLHLPLQFLMPASGLPPHSPPACLPHCHYATIFLVLPCPPPASSCIHTSPRRHSATYSPAFDARLYTPPLRIAGFCPLPAGFGYLSALSLRSPLLLYTGARARLTLYPPFRNNIVCNILPRACCNRMPLPAQPLTLVLHHFP